MRLLLRARVDRAKKDNEGQTAFEFARERGMAEVAAIIVKADIDVSLPTVHRSAASRSLLTRFPCSCANSLRQLRWF